MTARPRAASVEAMKHRDRKGGSDSSRFGAETLLAAMLCLLLVLAPGLRPAGAMAAAPVDGGVLVAGPVGDTGSRDCGMEHGTVVGSGGECCPAACHAATLSEAATMAAAPAGPAAVAPGRPPAGTPHTPPHPPPRA